MRDEDFKAVLDFFHLSWRGYRRVRKGVKRRVARHMSDLGCSSVGGYLHLLAGDPCQAREAERLLSVSVSRFFRDWDLWETLEDEVLPKFRGSGEPLRVWSAGCAMGQEAYSIAIIGTILKKRFGDFPAVKILATDVDPSLLEKAVQGRFPARVLWAIPARWRRSFFHPTGDGMTTTVDESLKGGIAWRVHDLLRDPPPAGPHHLVFLRNSLLTYGQPEKIGAAVRTVLQTIHPGGYLVIGRKESPGPFLEGLEIHERVPFLFRKTAFLPERTLPGTGASR
ncbi:MAG TPA: CheR family methyltransferase [Syntrophales bacterium]|nr:CheR family methyltransferase [Syntrophales bacterium]